MALSIPADRLEDLASALHRYRLAEALQRLHRDGAKIQIWANGAPVSLGERVQWNCRIRHRGVEVHASLCRKPQRDVIAHALQTLEAEQDARALGSEVDAAFDAIEDEAAWGMR